MHLLLRRSMSQKILMINPRIIPKGLAYRKLYKMEKLPRWDLLVRLKWPTLTKERNRTLVWILKTHKASFSLRNHLKLTKLNNKIHQTYRMCRRSITTTSKRPIVSINQSKNRRIAIIFPIKVNQTVNQQKCKLITHHCQEVGHSHLNILEHSKNSKLKNFC
jgi:hypothetical protein